MKSLLSSTLISIYTLHIYHGQCQCSADIGTQRSSMYDLRVHSSIYGNTSVTDAVNDAFCVDNLSKRLVFETNSSSFDYTGNGVYFAGNFSGNILNTPTSKMATLITFDSVFEECFNEIAFDYFVNEKMTTPNGAPPMQYDISNNNYFFSYEDRLSFIGTCDKGFFD